MAFYAAFAFAMLHNTVHLKQVEYGTAQIQSMLKHPIYPTLYLLKGDYDNNCMADPFARLPQVGA